MLNKNFSLSKKNIFGFLFLLYVSLEGAIKNTDFQLEGLPARIWLIIKIILFLVVLAYGEKYSKKTLIQISLVVAAALMTYCGSLNPQFLSAIMLAIVFSRIYSKNGFQFLFSTRLILMLVINALALVGIISMYEINVGKSFGYIIGYGLGYNHPNRYAYSFILLELLLVLWKNESINKKDYFIVMCMGVIGYEITKSRTLLLITLVLLLLIICYKNLVLQKRITRILNIIGRIIFPMLMLFSLTIPSIIAFGSGKLSVILSGIDLYISGRFSILSRVFEFYDVTLFGGVNEFSLLLQKYNYISVDNGYIRVLFRFGIVGSALFLLISVFTIHKLLERRDYIWVICCIMVALWGLSEDILLEGSFNVMILLWGILFEKNRNNHKKTKLRCH